MSVMTIMMAVVVTVTATSPAAFAVTAIAGIVVVARVAAMTTVVVVPTLPAVARLFISTATMAPIFVSATMVSARRRGERGGNRERATDYKGGPHLLERMHGETPFRRPTSGVYHRHTATCSLNEAAAIGLVEPAVKRRPSAPFSFAKKG